MRSDQGVSACGASGQNADTSPRALLRGALSRPSGLFPLPHQGEQDRYRQKGRDLLSHLVQRYLPGEEASAGSGGREARAEGPLLVTSWDSTQATRPTGQDPKQAEWCRSPTTHLWPDSWKSRLMLAGTQKRGFMSGG